MGAGKKAGWREYLLLFSTIVFTYLFIEFAYFVVKGFEPDPTNFTQSYFNRSSAYFDVKNGFLWKQGPTRFVRIIKGELVFDNTFHGNNRGYPSKHDFPHKRPPETKRIIVFGDSFTSAIFLDTSWPDRLHEILAGYPELGKIQIDSFAMDGGGVLNWYHTFQNEILPKYEFNGIIMAAFVGDFGRNFNISVSDERSVRTNYFLEPPPDVSQFNTAYLPQMREIARVATDVEIDDIIKEHQQTGWRAPPFRFYAFDDIHRHARWVFRERQPFEIWEYEEFLPARPMLSRVELNQRHPRVAPKVFEMMGLAKRNGIPFMITSIPNKKGAANFSIAQGQGQNEHQRELQSICALYGQDYFDGYEVFRDLSPDAIMEEMWLKYDDHWNQEGSDRYAEKLAEFIRSDWAAKIPTSSVTARKALRKPPRPLRRLNKFPRRLNFEPKGIKKKLKLRPQQRSP